MAILTALTLIRIHTLALLPLSYYLLTAPSTLTDQNLIFMLGEAMDIPQPPPSLFATANPAAALSGLLLILCALTDLTAFSLPEEQAHFFWRSAVPLRLLFFFAVTGGSYLGKPGAIMGAERGAGRLVVGMGGLREACCNSLVFTWGFLEMVFWFWMFVTLRDEGKKMGATVARRKDDEDRM